MLKKILLLLLAFALSLFMISCFRQEPPTQVAGGDDYPNGVQPLGKKSAQARSDSTDWNKLKYAPRTSPGMYDTTTIPDTLPDTAHTSHPAAKRSAAHSQVLPGLPSDTLPKLTVVTTPIDTIVTHTLDTAKGKVESVHRQVTDSVTHLDSTVFVKKDSSQPNLISGGIVQVSGKIIYADSNHWQAYHFVDADGDGFLAPRAGSLNRAKIDLTTHLSSGIVEQSTQVIGAGKDLSFNAHGDNQLITSTFLRKLGNDTLDYYQLIDADGDAIVIDFSRETNLVDLIEIHHLPKGSPFVTVSSKVRLVVYSRDFTQNYPIRFQETRLFGNGAVLEIVTKGLGSDSSFHAGENCQISETLTPPSSDSLTRRERNFTLLLSGKHGVFEENVLLGFNLRDTFREGDWTSFAFDFYSEKPIADGHWINNGIVQSSLFGKSSLGLSFTGEAVTTGITGQVKAPNGKITPLFFDKMGAIGPLP